MTTVYGLPPNWWKHSSLAWQEIDAFFTEPSRGLSNLSKQYLEEHLNEKNWKPISIGRSNDSYHFSTSVANTSDSREFFVKIINHSNRAFLPYERLISLKSIMSTDAYLQLAPWLVENIFQSKNVCIQTWFESESLDLSLNKNSNVIELLAEFLAALHSINTVRLPQFNLQKHLLKYQTIALNNKKNKILKHEINICVDKAISLLNSYQDEVLCHYDLNLNNILINKEMTIKIVDWEYVCIGDPLLDVTAIIENFQLSKQQESYFLCCYRQFSNKNSSKQNDISDKKLNHMKLLNQCIYRLWEYGQ